MSDMDALRAKGRSVPTGLAAISAVSLLAGCAPAPQRGDPAQAQAGAEIVSQEAPRTVLVANATFSSIEKVCDGDRAIYVLTSGSARSGITVVENAVECEATAQPAGGGGE